MAAIMTMANLDGHNLHPFFLPRGDSALADAEFNESNKARKRRRINSNGGDPVASGEASNTAWVEQLTTAAYGKPLASEDGGSSTATQRPRFEQPDGGEEHRVVEDSSIQDPKGASYPPAASPSLNPGEGRIKQNIPRKDSVTKTPPQEIPQTPIDDKGSSAITEEHVQDALPTKKMLKVRPDGKLSSPKSNNGGRRSKRRGAGKVSVVESAGKTLIAAMKYASSEQSRQEAWQRIEDILSGVEISPRPEMVQHLKKVEPAKPTHPFFLGGTLKTKGPGSLASDDEKILAPDAPPVKSRIGISPRKARVISKPASLHDAMPPSVPFVRHTFGTDYARVSRFPGAMEPLWPPEGMVNIGQESTYPQPFRARPANPQLLNTQRKMKSKEIKIVAEEDILAPLTRLVHSYQGDQKRSQKLASHDWREFPRPLRRLMTGRELQREVKVELRAQIATGQGFEKDQDKDELALSQPNVSQPPQAHASLRRVYEQIDSSRTAFDRFTCEAEDWAHKYAPKNADEVLQQGREAMILRDWLKGSTVHSTEDRNHSDRQSSISRKLEIKAHKRKRRRAEELDGFVVSSDDEKSHLDGIAASESYPHKDLSSRGAVNRGGNNLGSSYNCDKSANAIVLSGPHGCGKTAAVYAVAQELEFEVFEINAGSRRSGKDLLDKVGDMTRNHLVKHVPNNDANETKDAKIEGQDEGGIVNEKVKQDIDSGRQGTVNSFFKTKSKSQGKSTQKVAKAPKESPKKRPPAKKQSNQKQSLILLEEVDILFEEDKLFWATTLDLILRSKRPVIMTCTDESLIPLEDMIIYAVLRFSQAPQELAVEFILLIACNEGHLISREAISALYRAKRFDLRASLAELNFFCQMAIGDTKGGLEWMLIGTPQEALQSTCSQPVRVVSQDTYVTGMGWLRGEYSTSTGAPSFDEETGLLVATWNGWGIDIGASTDYLRAGIVDNYHEASKTLNLEALHAHEAALEGMSAADMLPTCASRGYDMPAVETAAPDLSDKMRSNYSEGSHLVHADPLFEPTGLSASITSALRVSARRLLQSTGHDKQTPNIEQTILQGVTDSVQANPSDKILTTRNSAIAFDPIARSTTPGSGLNIPRGTYISAFDVPSSIIAEDIAPFIRSIVSYDIRLEEQRSELNSLLSKPGLKGNKQRTTRASRAALEGGQKAHTRRERWFPKATNFDLVLQSGGKDWQDELQQLMSDA